MSQSLPRSEGEISENGHESDSGKGRETSRHTSRRSRSDSNGSPHITDSSISLYKTEPCQSFSETGYCRYGLKCRFAHGQADIRPLARHKKYKTELCKTYAKCGFCPYGARCRFVHDESERETSRTASPAPGVDLPLIKDNKASPALSPYVPAVSPSPMLPVPAALPLAVSPAPSSRKESVHIESSPSVMPVLPPPPQRGEISSVIHSHAPIRRPNSPALTPIGTPVNKPLAADMRPFDAFHSLSLSTGPDDSRSLRAYGARTTLSLRPDDSSSSSLFSDFGGGLAPLGPRSLSVPADHRTSSGPSAHVGGLRTSPPLGPPDLVRGLSLSVGHHPLEQPKVDPPSLAIPPSSILDAMTIKPLPLNTSSADAAFVKTASIIQPTDSKDDYYIYNRPTPRSAATRSKSFDISESYRSFSQEEELASCSSILSHLELHNDSQPLSPSTVEPPEARFKQLPPLYPKRQSFCYDDIAMLPTSSMEGRYDPRPKTPDIKQAANMNTIIATPPKSSPPYKPHSSPLHHSPLKLAQTPPPHGRASRARVSASSSPSQHSPLVIHHLDIESQLTGQFESLGRSKTDPRAPPAKKDVRLSAFAAPFSTPASPASAPSVSSRVASPMTYPSRSLFTSTSTSTSSSRSTHSPIVMHLTPDSSFNADTESTVLSLLSSGPDSSTPPATNRTSPALSPFPPPFFPKSPQKTSQQKRGSLRKLE